MSAVQQHGFENPTSDCELEDMFGHYFDRAKALADLIQSYSPDSEASIKTIRRTGGMLLVEAEDAQKAFNKWVENKKEASHG